MPEGKLIFVPTPIGNLEDITLRAIRVLREADVIAAEDTRKAKILLDKYEIDTPVFAMHVRNERKRAEGIIGRVKEGKTIAVISEAGTPGISDPGHSLSRMAIAENIHFEVLPGATAFVPAIVLSGFPVAGVHFEGFLSHAGKNRRRRLRVLKEDSDSALVFYVSPHRIRDFLTDAINILGDRKAVLCRELTKKFEEIIRGRLSEINSIEGEIIGELVLVISPEKEE